MKKFKKIYIEITNKCSLKCSFCSKLERELKTMTVSEFEYIINQVKPFTDYIYLHVKGEPLIHPNLKEILDIAYQNNIIVNITTNGTNIGKMLDLFKEQKCIRQINVSLHALEAINNKEEYLNNVVRLIEYVRNTKKFYLSLRIWIDNVDVNKYIKSYLCDKLNVEDINILGENIYWSYDEEFTWPNLNDEFFCDRGSCYGTKTHIAILVNGDVVPCCLDGNGVIKLGNVFEESLESILNGGRYISIRDGFDQNKLVEKLCQKCKYRRK